MNKFNFKKIAMGLAAPVMFSSFCVSNVIGMERKDLAHEIAKEALKTNKIVAKFINAINIMISNKTPKDAALTQFLDKTLTEYKELIAKQIVICENHDLLSKENELITDSKEIMTKLEKTRTKFETYMVSKNLLQSCQNSIELINLVINDKNFKADEESSENIDENLLSCAKTLVTLRQSSLDNNSLIKVRKLEKELKETKASAEEKGLNLPQLNQYMIKVRAI